MKSRNSVINGCTSENIYEESIININCMYNKDYIKQYERSDWNLKNKV